LQRIVGKRHRELLFEPVEKLNPRQAVEPEVPLQRALERNSDVPRRLASKFRDSLAHQIQHHLPVIERRGTAHQGSIRHSTAPDLR
jgi:hypothetical protein